MRTAVVCVVLCCLHVYVASDCVDSLGNTRTAESGSYIGRDHCNTCKCLEGMEACTKMICLPGHSRCMGPDYRVYTEGQSFKAADGCNTCTCSNNGLVACTLMACNTE